MSEPQKVEVIVKKDKDDETKKDEVERLKAKLDTERIEKEDALNKLTLVAQKEFERKKKSVKCGDDEVTTPEQLKAWMSGAGKKSKDYLDPTQKPSSGTLTLQGQVSTTNFLEKKYEADSEGFRQLVDDLHEKARSNDPEVAAQSQAILDHLLLKAVKSDMKGDVPMKLDMEKHNKEKAEKKNE